MATRKCIFKSFAYMMSKLEIPFVLLEYEELFYFVLSEYCPNSYILGTTCYVNAQSGIVKGAPGVPAGTHTVYSKMTVSNVCLHNMHVNYTFKIGISYIIIIQLINL